MDVPWLDADQQRAWRAYLDVGRLLQTALERQMREDNDMSLADYELLVRLSEAPSRMLHMAELADAAIGTRSGTTRAVDRLEQRGWVRRSECPSDKRATHARLTDEGFAALRAAAPGHVRAVRRHFVDVMTSEEQRVLGEAFVRVRDRLQGRDEGQAS